MYAPLYLRLSRVVLIRINSFYKNWEPTSQICGAYKERQVRQVFVEAARKKKPKVAQIHAKEQFHQVVQHYLFWSDLTKFNMHDCSSRTRAESTSIVRSWSKLMTKTGTYHTLKLGTRNAVCSYLNDLATALDINCTSKFIATYTLWVWQVFKLKFFPRRNIQTWQLG